MNHVNPEDVTNATDDWHIDLKALGCSDPHGVHDFSEMVRFGEVRVAPSFSWISTFGSELLEMPVLIYVLGALLLALTIPLR